jgi:hypothetical protein
MRGRFRKNQRAFLKPLTGKGRRPVPATPPADRSPAMTKTLSSTLR